MLLLLPSVVLTFTASISLRVTVTARRTPRQSNPDFCRWNKGRNICVISYHFCAQQPLTLLFGLFFSVFRSRYFVSTTTLKHQFVASFSSFPGSFQFEACAKQAGAVGNIEARSHSCLVIRKLTHIFTEFKPPKYSISRHSTTVGLSSAPGMTQRGTWKSFSNEHSSAWDRPSGPCAPFFRVFFHPRYKKRRSGSKFKVTSADPQKQLFICLENHKPSRNAGRDF